MFEQSEIQELVREFSESLSKANANSISTGTGLNFLQLEETAKNTYAVFHPLLDMIPRVSPTELGQEVGGLQTTWDQVLTPGTNVLPSIAEGSRSQYINIPTRRTSANYVTMGTDASVTFEAESAGRGHNDNLGTARLASLNVLLNLEERMAIFGNSGTGASGQNGFVLTTTQPAAPGIALAKGGSIGIGKTCAVAVVPLTGWGVFNASTFGKNLGVAQTVAYTSADGTSLVNNGGTGIPSAFSAVVTTTSDDQAVQITVQPIPGAFGYAAYIDSDDASSPPVADAYFVGVYTTSVFTITSLPNKSKAQKLSALAASDYSGNPPNAGYTTGDFDGVCTWLVGSLGTTGPQAYVVDLAGANLNSDGAGGVKEVELAISTQWVENQTTPDAVLVSSDVMSPFQKAMQSGQASTGATTVYLRTGDPNDPNAIGGSFIGNYKCKFSAFGRSKVLPIINIPWMPGSTILLPTFTNPYPAAGNAIPANFRMVCREGYYALKYPYVTRLHSQGVYVEETLENYVPWAGSILSSVGND